jgi:arylsulfatase A-like enzyme
MMIIKKYITLVILVCITFSVSAQSKPNVIIIMADDLGYYDLGYNNNNTYYLTPTIDSLAKKSMVMNNFYSMPTCSPTRASLMTGCYPSRHGIYAVDAFSHTPDKMRMLLGGESKKQLDKETYTMPLLFKAAGYHTALIGKWHLGDNPLQYQNKPVFDEMIGVAKGQEGHPDEYYLPTKNIKFKDDPSAPTYLTDRLTYEAKNYIKANASQPFFLYLAHYAPHVPLHAKKEDAAHFDNRKPNGLQNRPSYAGMVYSVDRSVKEILAQLKESNLLANTIIIFMSDNGGQLMSTGNAPFSGQKGEILEGGIRVPAFVWYKGVKVMANNSLTCVVDVLPTLSDIIHQPLPENIITDGQSWQALLQGKTDAERSVYFHFPGYTGNGTSNANVWQSPASAVRYGKWKLIQSLETNEVQLLDIRKDIQEKNNVAKQNPAVVKKMLDKLKDWQQQTGANIPTEKNAAYDAASRKWIEKKDTRKEKDNTDIRIE